MNSGLYWLGFITAISIVMASWAWIDHSEGKHNYRYQNTITMIFFVALSVFLTVF